jgi:pimeloyl-ACP methyl ester carboxylesterase
MSGQGQAGVTVWQLEDVGAPEPAGNPGRPVHGGAADGRQPMAGRHPGPHGSALRADAWTFDMAGRPRSLVWRSMWLVEHDVGARREQSGGLVAEPADPQACQTAPMGDVAARTLGRVAANGIELAYETFGDASAPPVVLIMGLATQMIAWPDELCDGLAQRGFLVIRFDNRDVGGSTHLRNVPPPRLADIVVRRPPPYSIGDMANDVVGLIDGLGLDDVHLVGVSMGGFIAQTVALEHADRIRTLTLIMTSTGSRRVGQAKPRVYARLLRPRVAADRSAAMSAVVETFRLIGSRGFAFDEEYLRDLAGRSWDRGYEPAGSRRQLAATVNQPNRTAALRRITVPTLVIHGLHDPLVGPSGGLAIAKAIPNSRFVGFSGMGHDLPRALWHEFVREIAAVAALGEQRRRLGPPTD